MSQSNSPSSLCADQFRQARHGLEREQNIGDRGSIGHEGSSASFRLRRAGLIGQRRSRLNIDEIRNARDRMTVSDCSTPSDAPGPGDGRSDRRGGGVPASRAASSRCRPRPSMASRPTPPPTTAVAAIYAAKGRPAFNPLIAHVSGVEAARALARFDAARGAARARLLAGAAHACAAGRTGLPRQPARPGGTRLARASRAGPCRAPAP